MKYRNYTQTHTFTLQNTFYKNRKIIEELKTHYLIEFIKLKKKRKN